MQSGGHGEKGRKLHQQIIAFREKGDQDLLEIKKFLSANSLPQLQGAWRRVHEAHSLVCQMRIQIDRLLTEPNQSTATSLVPHYFEAESRLIAELRRLLMPLIDEVLDKNH